MFRNLVGKSMTWPGLVRGFAKPPKSISVRLSSVNLQTRLENFQHTTKLEQIKLAATSPLGLINAIETAWEAKQLPFSDEVVAEYILAAGAAKRLDSIDFNKFFSLIRSNGLAQSGAMSSTAGFGAGSTPNFPLYASITKVPLSLSDQIKEGSMKVLSGLLLLGATFMVLNYFGMIPDSSKAGGASGLGRLAGLGSKSVRRAEKPDKRFTDVVGVDEAKAELQEIVEYLKNPSKFTRLGGNLPKGVLLTGPPGTGKTLLAKSIAGEAGVPFFYAAGSEFEEMFVGVGASRVRELFTAAKAVAPCIIFLDEIDAMGGSRNLKDQSAMKMTLNQLLTEMDGFESNPGIIVIGATNFAESLDKALTRPGRFDKHVEVPLPDVGGRLQILELYGGKVPIDNDVDFQQLARGTPGFSGAELHNLINQASLKAAMEGLQRVSMGTLEFAKDKIMMGAERKTAVLSPESMRCTAFHEAGHALMALKTEGADPIHKATIMPRGRSLGMVMQLPDGDQTSMSRKQMLARMDVCMGGRVAEELVFGVDNVTSGASSDIQQATRLARAMIMKYGFSEKLGFLFIDEKDSPVSGQTNTIVDDEIRKLLDNSYARAKAVLLAHRSDLNKIAAGLLEYESLSGNEIVDICKGIKPVHGVPRSQKPSRQPQAIPMPSATTVNGNTRSNTSAGASSAGAGSASAGSRDEKGAHVPVSTKPTTSQSSKLADKDMLAPPNTTNTTNTSQSPPVKATVPVTVIKLTPNVASRGPPMAVNSNGNSSNSSTSSSNGNGNNNSKAAIVPTATTQSGDSPVTAAAPQARGPPKI